MHKNIVALILLLLSGFPTTELLADGAEVVLTLKSGKEITEELLSVRENALVMSRTGALEYRLEIDPEEIMLIAHEEIQTLTIQGKSYILSGMGVGIVVGIVTGALIAANAETRDDAYKAIGSLSWVALAAWSDWAWEQSSAL